MKEHAGPQVLLVVQTQVTGLCLAKGTAQAEEVGANLSVALHHI